MIEPPVQHADREWVRTRDGRGLWVTDTEVGAERPPWIVLGLLVAAAALLRAVHLEQGLWWDEIRTVVDSVRFPLRHIVTVYPGDNQHTLFSVLAHLSVTVFGESPWSVRLPAVLFGVATIPALYVFAREFVGRGEALAASLLLTVSYHHVWFSQSARGYALLACFALLASTLLLRGLRRNRSSDFLWYGVVAAAAIYTHVTMVFLVVAHVALCVLPLGWPWPLRAQWPRWRGPMVGFALAGVLALLLNIPFLLDVREAVVTAPSPMRGATPQWAFLEVLRGMQLGLGGLLGALAGGTLFLVGVWSYWRQSTFVLGLFLLPGVLTVAASIALHRPVRPRFVFFLAGFLVLIVVRGALTIGRWLDRRSGIQRFTLGRAGTAIIALLTMASVASLGPNYRLPKQDFLGAMDYVDRHARTGDLVVTAGGARYPYRAYFGRTWQGVESAAQLREFGGGGAPIWVVHTMDSYIRAEAPDLMALIDSECRDPQRFRGTVADGDVVVCRVSPTPVGAAEPAPR